MRAYAGEVDQPMIHTPRSCGAQRWKLGEPMLDRLFLVFVTKLLVESRPMRAVSRFEANLLRILHCFLGHGEVGVALPAIVRPLPRPNCLSRDAIELVQQALATGTVMLLTRGGAWTRQRHLRDDQISEGRLWERTQPEKLGMRFSSASLEFLIWLTEADASRPTATLTPQQPSLTLGDQFLIFRAARTLRDTTIVNKWYRNPAIRSNALIALTMPEYFAEAKVDPAPDFQPWMTDTGACVLEAMQDELAGIWVRLEKNKSKVSQTDFMRRFGKSQESVLKRLFDAVEQHQRRDLCRFLLEALTALLSGQSRREQWIASLDTTGLRIAERTEIYQSASAFLRATGRLRQWHAASLGVGYFDEGYAESQLWKSQWESADAGKALDHADRIVKELAF